MNKKFFILKVGLAICVANSTLAMKEPDYKVIFKVLEEDMEDKSPPSEKKKFSFKKKDKNKQYPHCILKQMNQDEEEI